MLRKIFPLILIIIFPFSAGAMNYIGLGATYSIPVFSSADNQTQALGGTFMFESRRYCNLWFGLKIDYTDLEPLEDADEYYETAISFSPFARYVFTEEVNCYKPALLPYAMLSADISSVEGNYGGLPLGLGGSAGAGIVVPFSLAKRCFSIDLNASLAAPNLIRSEERPRLYLIKFGVILSAGL